MNSRSFVTLDNVVGAILLEINDEQNNRYKIKATQWALDEFRNLNIHLSPYYYERKVTLDSDLFTGEYPKDLISLLAVGIYRNGEFWPFTKKQSMSIMAPDMEDNIYESSDNDTETIPEYGVKFGYRGSNIGYWADDSEHCRFFVRNYNYSTYNQSYVDTTSDLIYKVVIRYKTSGLDCTSDLCIPTEARDLIIQKVYYRFMRKNIPVQVTADEKDRQERIINALQDQYETLKYEPMNLWDVKDTIWGSLNSTARR